MFSVCVWFVTEQCKVMVEEVTKVCREVDKSENKDSK